MRYPRKVTSRFECAYDSAALVLAIALAWTSTAMGEVERYRTANGVSCLVAPRPSSGLAAVQLWVRAGAACDGEGRGGLAHLVEHLVWRGTRDIASFGGTVDARTGHDYTVFAATAPAAHTIEVVEALARSVLDVDFGSDAVERERAVILEELLARGTEPGWLSSEATSRRVFEGTPYARPVLGTFDSVERLRRRHLFEYLGQHYTKDATTLVVAGSAEPGAIVQSATDAFAELEPGVERAAHHFVAAGFTPIVDSERAPSTLAVRGPGAAHPASVARPLVGRIPFRVVSASEPQSTQGRQLFLSGHPPSPDSSAFHRGMRLSRLRWR
mgnify:CR=1 FL=1